MLRNFGRRGVFRALSTQNPEFPIAKRLIPPRNFFGVVAVPQDEAWVIERLGKCDRVLGPGLGFVIPGGEKVAHRFSLKENVESVSNQSAITLDNVLLSITGTLFWRITSPRRAAYAVADPHAAVRALTRTALRGCVGGVSLDATLRGRGGLGERVAEAVNERAQAWGVQCLRVGGS
eukprot:TRINITY_DN3403_c0_g3_i1.p1 TRINITY_DN3403_c0_g3~~TRINITY_DN3403_c0_g3_i1.p1  ORF type:complete len:195 (-),score=41.99 TRINITY_DN3403_c0_g3_i1:420-950(-)